MVSLSSRTLTALIGLVLSLPISAAAWYYFDTLLLFLFVPLVPFLFRGSGDASDPRERGAPDLTAGGERSERRGGRGRDDARPERRRCPVCGFETREESFDYCPRDGTRLE